MVFRMILENQVNEAAFRQTVLTNGWRDRRPGLCGQPVGPELRAAQRRVRLHRLPGPRISISEAQPSGGWSVDGSRV